jgi:hypothetical protein
MDKTLAKRKTEFQTVQKDTENLIEHKRTEFKSHVESRSRRRAEL